MIRIQTQNPELGDLNLIRIVATHYTYYDVMKKVIIEVSRVIRYHTTQKNKSNLVCVNIQFLIINMFSDVHNAIHMDIGHTSKYWKSE